MPFCWFCHDVAHLFQTGRLVYSEAPRSKVNRYAEFLVDIKHKNMYNSYYLHMSHDTTKHVSSGVSDQARHKPACAATEANYSYEISAIESRDITLSKQRTIKALIRLRGCAG